MDAGVERSICLGDTTSLPLAVKCLLRCRAASLLSLLAAKGAPELVVLLNEGLRSLICFPTSRYFWQGRSRANLSMRPWHFGSSHLHVSHLSATCQSGIARW